MQTGGTREDPRPGPQHGQHTCSYTNVPHTHTVAPASVRDTHSHAITPAVSRTHSHSHTNISHAPTHTRMHHTNISLRSASVIHTRTTHTYNDTVRHAHTHTGQTRALPNTGRTKPRRVQDTRPAARSVTSQRRSPESTASQRSRAGRDPGQACSSPAPGRVGPIRTIPDTCMSDPFQSPHNIPVHVTQPMARGHPEPRTFLR